MTINVAVTRLLAVLLASGLTACSSLGSSGPSTSGVMRSEKKTYASNDIKVVDLDENAVRRAAAFSRSRNFDEVFGDSAPADTIIGNGDVLDIQIWEAPPAVLFGPALVDGRQATAGSLAQGANFPAQAVRDDGSISLPFVGSIRVAGETPRVVEQQIRSRLTGKAHDPQVIVRLTQNEARNITILGDVPGSRRLPLSAKGERLLDALAAAGGPRQPVGKVTVQLSRGPAVATMSLDTIIRDPKQNVRLKPDDVVTVLYQPYSFIALGAVSQNAEVPFEGGGLTLAQALGRIGGLRDERADIRGVFIFRMEQPSALDPAVSAQARTTINGRVPVVYRLNLADASSFFVAQDFLIQDDDILYVSNAPLADLQKFLTTLSSVAFSTIAISDSISK